MTNKEIKLELAKSLLANPNFLPKDETLRNLFSWIIESNETNTAKESETEYSAKPIDEILSHVTKMRYNLCLKGHLETILHDNNIRTVGDLLEISRFKFKRYRNVGKMSICCIDEALEELYGIKSW